MFRAALPFAPDFITYSEGANDDVNKFVWSGLGWDPEQPVVEILKEYSRYFIGEAYTDTFAQGLLALERNWRGPLATNAGVYATLEQFQAMERAAAPRDLLNWRLQQGLYRAYYDAYQRARLLHEAALEERAMERLRAAPAMGAAASMAEARRILADAERRPAPAWRERVYALAEALFQSIRQQLSVSRYRAIAIDRGATLDTAETPLNNRVWLEAQFAQVLALDAEPARLAALDRVVRWTDPGPGGFYDDLGDAAQQPHLVRGPGFAKDPGLLESVSTGFGSGLISDTLAWRLSWVTHAESFSETPLEMRYTGLDPAARYRVRVLYAGDMFAPTNQIRLVANGQVEVHPLLSKRLPIAPQEFDVPHEATRGGTLTLTWTNTPGLGRFGKGNQIAEVWLRRHAGVTTRDQSR